MMQPTSRPNIDERLIKKSLDVYYLFVEPDRKEVAEWCQGVVVTVLQKDKVIIKWDQKSLIEGKPETSEQKLVY